MSDIDFALEKLKDYKQLVDELMVDFAENDLYSRDYNSEYAKNAFEKMAEFGRRPAKRVRAALVMIAYEMYGGKDQEVVNRAAIATELIQNAFLIIDDVMDKSAFRRTKPSVHMIYRDELKSSGVEDNNHMADMVAVNVGFVASKIATRVISSIELTNLEDSVKAMRLFEANTTRTAVGQVEDMYNNKHFLLSEEEIMEILTNKSSYYTFVGPLQTGAALAGASDEEIVKLKDFGVPAGLVYQIRDDYLGLLGNEKDTGKPSYDDIKEGKITLLMRRAIEQANSQDRKIIMDTLGNSGASSAEFERVRQIVKDSDAVKYVEALSNKFCSQALNNLETLSVDKEPKRVLGGLIDYIANRSW